MFDAEAHKSSAGDPSADAAPGGGTEDVLQLLAEIDAVCGGGPAAAAPAPGPGPSLPDAATTPATTLGAEMVPSSAMVPESSPASPPPADASYSPSPSAAPEDDGLDFAVELVAPEDLDHGVEPGTALPERPAGPVAGPSDLDAAVFDPADPEAASAPAPAGYVESPEPSPSQPPRAASEGDAAPTPPADRPLRDMDGALADDVEELLQGEFETVSAVLDDFDDPETTGSEPAGATVPVAAAATETATEETWAAPEPLPARVAPTLEPLPERPGPASEPDEPEPESAMLPSRAVPEPESVPEPAPVAAVALPDDDAGLAAPPRPARGRFAVVETVVVAVLRLVNLPLRLVPPRLHPVVDWIALSLVFWVPIVWVFALLVVGR